MALFAGPGTDPATLAAEVRAALAEHPRLRALTGDARATAEPDPDAGLLLVAGTLLGETAGVAAFVATFVVAGTFAFAVSQRRRELALLSAAGATPRQIRRLVLLVAMLLILGAALLAPVLVPPLLRALGAGARGPVGQLARACARTVVRRSASPAAPILVTIGLAGAALIGTATFSATQAQSVRDHVTAPVVLVPTGEAALPETVTTEAARLAGVATAAWPGRPGGSWAIAAASTVRWSARMGHTDSSIGVRFAHVTDAMRHRLLAGLTNRWEEALAARRAISPGSPVAVLDALLRGR